MANGRKYEKFARGLHLSGMEPKHALSKQPKMVNSYLLSSEEAAVEKVWWGITVGSQAFASKAESLTTARTDVAEFMGLAVEQMVEVPTITHEFGPEQNAELDARFGERKVIKLIPYSLEEWPDDTQNMTDSQTEALAQFLSEAGTQA